MKTEYTSSISDTKLLINKLLEDNPKLKEIMIQISGYSQETFAHSMSCAITSCVLVDNMSNDLVKKLTFDLDSYSNSNPVLEKERKDYLKKRLTVAALVHDTGKLFIPLSILHKPGKLTDDERAIMNTHSRLGYNKLCEIFKDNPVKDINNTFLDDSKIMQETILSVAGLHHTAVKELDKENLIQLYSNLISSIDITEALSADRSYKPAFAWDRIKDITQENIDDKKILSAFGNLMIDDAQINLIDEIHNSVPETFFEFSEQIIYIEKANELIKGQYIQGDVTDIMADMAEMEEMEEMRKDLREGPKNKCF